MAKQNYGGVYANMDFKPYAYTEYPKHIPTGPHGKFETANDAMEEKAILAKLQKDEDDAPAIAMPFVSDHAKDILISRATELGVAFNPKWSKMKLEQTVKQAEEDTDNLPADVVGTRKVKPIIDMTATEIDSEPEISKDDLIAQAKALGIPANKLWGIPRLKSSIAEASKDA